MTRTKADIVENISKGTGIPVQEVRTIIEAFMEEVKDVFYNNDRLELRGFGVFENRFRKGKIGRNPKTKEVVKIPDRLVPTYKAPRRLKKEIERIGFND
ncbi:integration host factor subunit beta [candidate division WOR-3 bacterium]|nr:integration host factor subunit beta [candidate division WOR-3 bacterium]MCK4526345.1 integration host factor subunit beta [candidate division WOR-3 bacterium]